MTTPRGRAAGAERRRGSPNVRLTQRRHPGGVGRPVLNFFPTELSRKTCDVWVGSWQGPEHADALREQIPMLSTWRDGENGALLYAWRHAEALSSVPGLRAVSVALDENPRLFQRLLTEAISSRLGEVGFSEHGWGFVNFSKPSLITRIPALASIGRESIGIYPKILLDVFFTRPPAGELLIGPVVDVLYTTLLDTTAAEWVATGLQEELLGRYVVLRQDSPEAEHFPELRLKVIGRLDAVRSDRCVLGDTRDPGVCEVGLDAVAPEPNKANLEAYLAGRHKQAFERGEEQLANQLASLVRPRERHRLADALIRNRLMEPGDLEILPGLGARVGSMLALGPDTLPVRRLVEPGFSFDRSGNKHATRVDVGLRKFGPYDETMMGRRSFKVLVVAPAEHEGEVREGVRKLVQGIPTDQNVFGGLRQMYRLRDLTVEYAFAPGSDAAPMTAYANAVHAALRAAPVREGLRKFDLIVSVIRHDHRSLPDSENPYYQTKALALVQDGIPTQALTIEKLRVPDGDLQYVLNTMALACYAKLGGTSHVLKIPDTASEDSTELIFGIGRSVRRSGRFGDAEETVGFATVFRANGEYLYNDCTPYCSGTEYESAMETTIRRTIEKVAAFERLPDDAALRLIFHLPRRPGRREEVAVLNAVNKLPRFRTEFALVHVNDDHHLQLFDLGNQHPTRWKKPFPRAALLPERGLCVELGPRERLISYIGPQQYRGYGSPSPLRITVDRRSTFKDVDYLANQAFMLSFMNVGTLNPGVQPISIAYPEKQARLTGHLRGVQQWTVELIQDRLGRELWFV